jgi:hypothetical protein
VRRAALGVRVRGLQPLLLGFQPERLRDGRGRRDRPVGWADRSLPQQRLGRSTFLCDRQGAERDPSRPCPRRHAGPLHGLAHGQSASFSFFTKEPAVYRIASLVPGQQQSGMWDVLEITRSELPRVILLRPVP